MSITNKLNQIKNAIYGKEVRGAIHDAIKQVYDDASVNHDNANMEVQMARGTHNTLNDRLNNVDQIQAQTNAQLSHLTTKGEGLLFLSSYKCNIADCVGECGGVRGDGIHDDSSGLQKAINDAINNKCTLYLNPGVYLTKKTIVIDNAINVIGNRKLSVIKSNVPADEFALIVGDMNGITGVVLSGFTLEGNNSNKGMKWNKTDDISKGIVDSRFSNIDIRYFSLGLETSFSWCNKVDNVRIQSCAKPAAFGNQTNHTSFDRVSFVTFNNTITMINCEGLEFSSCEVANLSDDTKYAIRTYQSTINFSNPYIENIKKFVELGSQGEIIPSSLTIFGGHVGGEVNFKNHKSILCIEGSREHSHKFRLAGEARKFIDSNNIKLNFISTKTNIEVVSHFKKNDNVFPFQDAWGGTATTKRDAGGYLEITSPQQSQGIKLSDALEKDVQYILAIEMRKADDVRLNIRTNTALGVEIDNSEKVFTKYIAAFINDAENGAIRMEWQGVLDIKEITLYKMI